MNQQDKISNQIKNSTEVLEKACEICLESFNVLSTENAFLDCGCVIHSDCFMNFLENGINSRDINFNCPSCGKKINPKVVNLCLEESPVLLTKYNKFEIEEYMLMHKDEVSCCPTPDCSYMFIYKEGNDSHKFECPNCQKKYCLKCKVKYHEGDTCQEYYNREHKDEIDAKHDKKFHVYVTKKNFKCCPKCGIFVERIEVLITFLSLGM